MGKLDWFHKESWLGVLICVGLRSNGPRCEKVEDWGEKVKAEEILEVGCHDVLHLLSLVL